MAWAKLLLALAAFVAVLSAARVRGFKTDRPLWDTAEELSVPSASDGSYELAPLAFKPLRTGSITPKGWLLEQLKLQAQGLSGHLAQFWPDIQDSIWVGGKHDVGGTLNQNAPYWLNGIVPLAYLLKNAGEEQLPAVAGIYKQREKPATQPETPHSPLLCKDGLNIFGGDIGGHAIEGFNGTDKECNSICQNTSACLGWVYEGPEVPSCQSPTAQRRCYLKATINLPPRKQACTCSLWHTSPPTPVPAPTPLRPANILDQAKLYMDYIRSHQQEDGWLGPSLKDGDGYWGPSNVMFAMLMYAEAEPAVFTNVTGVMLNYMLSMHAKLPKTKLARYDECEYDGISASTISRTTHQCTQRALWGVSTSLPFLRHQRICPLTHVPLTHVRISPLLENVLNAKRVLT
jgi:hypothetical protein